VNQYAPFSNYPLFASPYTPLSHAYESLRKTTPTVITHGEIYPDANYLLFYIFSNLVVVNSNENCWQ